MEYKTRVVINQARLITACVRYAYFDDIYPTLLFLGHPLHTERRNSIERLFAKGTNEPVVTTTYRSRERFTRGLYSFYNFLSCRYFFEALHQYFDAVRFIFERGLLHAECWVEIK